jgi:hypothetical protein
MEKPKTNSNYYFTQETEDAIVLYNSTSDPLLRDKIFRDKIYYPFYKLVENIIHTFKFYYTDVDDIEDLKLEIVSVLVEEKIHRFDPTNGAKAFSYFQTIVKRWLINYNNRNYKKVLQVGTFDEMVDSWETENEFEHERVITLSALIDNFVKQSYEGMDTIFPKDYEQKVADAVLTLFKSRGDLEIIKKKALYIYVREMTDCETPVLTRVISKLKVEFYNLYSKYQEAGYEIQ